MFASSDLFTNNNNISYFSPVPAVTSESSLNEGNHPALPPFEILLEWLDHYHTHSGSWPTPPLSGKTQACSVNRKLRVVSGAKPPQEVSRESAHIYPSTSPSSNRLYDYRSSVYYRAATDIAASNNAYSSISPGALLVLSSVLAWSHHSFFKDKCLATNFWMSLPLSRWSRELKMRKASLSAHLHELQEAGLISYGTIKDNILQEQEFQLLTDKREEFLHITSLNTGFSSYNKPPRFLPGSIRIYRLSVTLPKPLPAFELADQAAANPFNIIHPGDTQTAAVTYTGADYQEPQAETAGCPEPGKNLSGAVPGNQEPVNGALITEQAPCTCNYLIHDIKTNKNHDMSGLKITKSNVQSLQENPDPDAANLQINSELTTQSDSASISGNVFLDEIFTYLTVEALFPGFSRMDGRQTLDEREALKFASCPGFTLQKVRQIYSQVLSLWKAGKCNKNPIGFLHNRLTQHLSGINSLSGTGSPDTADSITRTKKAFQTLSFPSKENQPQSRFHSSSPVNLLSDDPSESASGENVEDVSQEHFSANIDPLLVEKILPTLKQSVVNSLSERYRRAELGQLVEIRDWKISGCGEELQIYLAEPSGNFYPYYFGEGDKALLKLVISQDLTPLIGKRVSIQLLNCR